MNYATRIICSLALCMSSTACAPNYSEGSRVGVITKLSHKGLVFKSWEGQINVGGFRNETDSKGNVSVVANVIDFSVTDPALIPRLQEAMRLRAPVELSYTQWFLHPITIQSDYVAVSVTDAQP